MKKDEIIDKLLNSDYWEHIFPHFAIIGMKKSTKKELMKWLNVMGENNE